ncbi:MAG: lipid-A-disaccharide synthase [Gammaproteobacteria bacterium]
MPATRLIRIFISAGEVSGDLHGGYLIEALRREAAARGYEIAVTGLGGARMRAMGARLIADTTRLGAVGLAEALPYVLPTLRLGRRARQSLTAEPPDALVLIDYPGLNIPLASALHGRLPAPIIYYIPPEEWVWSTKGNGLLDRSHKIARGVDYVLATHPLEAEFYRGIGCQVEAVGHPLRDIVSARRIDRNGARQRLGIAGDQRIVTLLPASRTQEWRLVWPAIAAASARLLAQQPNLRFLLPLASPFLRRDLIRALADSCQRYPALAKALTVLDGADQEDPPSGLAIAAADLAITKSGTVTLELALQDVPQVAVYRLKQANIWLGRYLLRMTEADVVNLTLINHIMQRPIVPEFLLFWATPEAISTAALQLIPDQAPARASQLDDYRRLRERIGPPGAIARAARCILQWAGIANAHQPDAIAAAS